MRLIFSILMLCFIVSSFAQKQYSLTVKVTGIENYNGEIELALYKDPKKFAKVGQTYRLVRIKPDNSTLTHEFKNLDQGKYAICLFHDENNNKVCDKNFIGIPTEAYAFSNNIRPRLSVPTFEECSTYLDKNKTFSIKLVY
jgi:uncharacterized protein (DUF2141 family)